MERIVRRILRAVLLPIRLIIVKYFDPRFGMLKEQIDKARGEGQDRLHALQSVQEQAQGFQEGAERSRRSSEDHFFALQRFVSESFVFVGKQLRDISDNQKEFAVRSMYDPMQGVFDKLEFLTPEHMKFLNYAESHLGYKAQAGMWFNWPISVGYDSGRAVVGNVNERIIEVPYVFAACQQLSQGSSILDVGCTESTVSLSLASLGYQVTGLDLRPYPLKHDNLVSVALPLEEWDVPQRNFDAVVCLSSVEHFGLGAYGESGGESEADRNAMHRLHTLTKPGGLLVFTAPFGVRETTDSQRIYDLEALNELLVDWQIQSLRLAAKVDGGQWQILGGPEAADDIYKMDDPGVVLVTAHAKPDAS